MGTALRVTRVDAMTDMLLRGVAVVVSWVPGGHLWTWWSPVGHPIRRSVAALTSHSDSEEGKTPVRSGMNMPNRQSDKPRWQDLMVDLLGTWFD